MISGSLMEKLKELKLSGMLEAFRTIIETGRSDDMTNDEFLNYLVESEWNDKNNRKLLRRIKTAKFRYSASIENIQYVSNRNLNKNNFLRLADCSFIKRKENIIITGLTGCGKSYIATAIGNQACHKGFKVLYFNAGKLLSTLKMKRADNTSEKEKNKISKHDLIIIDDFGLHSFDNEDRLNLFEIIEDRHSKKSTIFTSQFPVKNWHSIIGEATIADSIMDRIVYSSHRIELKGESMRKKFSKILKEDNLCCNIKK